MEDMFNIENFNIIEDEENYYFIRALNMADNKDLENGTILDEFGNYERIRTDRERYEENPENKEPKYNETSKISLEEVFDHIKMHYRKDTNCISLSSNANVAISYGRSFYKDKYVMIKVSKKEFGEKVVNAGQYMLEEIEKRIESYVLSREDNVEIEKKLAEIDECENVTELKSAIQEAKYTVNRRFSAKKRKGIIYKAPTSKFGKYKALSEEQELSKNKIIAKLTYLERHEGMSPIIPNTINNNFLIQTVGNAFSSLELIHYGEIKKEEIIDIPKEFVDLFALIQQVEKEEKQIVNDYAKIDKSDIAELKRLVMKYMLSGQKLKLSQDMDVVTAYQKKENISIEEMYELTEGKVEYGKVNSIIDKMFYLAKGQQNARNLSFALKEITNNNPKFENIVSYIENKGFVLEPQIITRKSNKGYKISESVSLDLQPNEFELVSQIGNLDDNQQMEIITNGGFADVNGIMTLNFSKVQSQEKISKDRYYAEAVFSLYDWKKIGIEEFTIDEKNNFLQRMQNEYCIDLYQKLETSGINKNDIPIIVLNIISKANNFEITEEDTKETIKAKRLEQYDKLIQENISDLKQELSIEKVERFLGYYDVKETGIQLRPYQQRAKERTDEILNEERFASVILPTGGGKSFVALAQLMEHKNEEMLYLAPQNELLEQMKDYIIKYIHGPVNTIGKSKDEIVAEVFPNLKFATYPGLLSKKADEIIDKEYSFIVLDELHRTGAKEWGNRLNDLIDNQPQTTKVLGITATPRRDSDGINMANEMAEKLGYTNQDAVKGKHIAMNMSLTNAIRMGLVVNPRLVSCVYNLKEDGSLDGLKEQIYRIENIEVKKEKLEKYEALRKKIDKVKGISEILQANVKKGGKYIVFLPVIDQIEDEDGNVIGRKKGKDKLKDYEKQISEYFKDSNKTLKFHSMLGEYGDEENKKRLEEFQSSKSDDVEFMLVINKANEGLHLDNLDGMIWFRAMDENSRILYLQQLGRVIYSEDPDNPTKDEERPVVIDLVNNTLKVNWDNEITEQDDIELLTIILDWYEKHNGILPDINCTDKEEVGYATVLKAIQDKYKKYLEVDFEECNEKQKKEIEEILRLGFEIDLWQIDLPEKIQKEERYSRKVRNKEINEYGPCELVGLVNDFVELKSDVSEFEKESAIAKLVRVCEVLKEQGFKFENFSITKSIEKNGNRKKVGKILEDVRKEYPSIDIEKVIKETGVELDYSIGNIISNARRTCKGYGDYTITEEEKQKLIKMGVVSLEKESTISKLVRVCEALKEQGFIFEEFSLTKQIEENGNKKTIGKTLKDVEKEYPRIDIEKIMEETKVTLDYSIGQKIFAARQAFNGKEKSIITEEEKQKLTKMGVVSLEKESAIAKLVRVCEVLKEQGFIFEEFSLTKQIKENGNKKAVYKTLEDIGKEYLKIDIEKIMEETKVTLDYSIGKKIYTARQASNGKGKSIITEEEKQKLTKMGVVSLEKESAIAKLVRVCEALKEQGFIFEEFFLRKTVDENGDRKYMYKTLEDIGKEYSNINIEKVLEDIGIELDYSIGMSINNARSACKGTGANVITEDEKQKLIEIGVVSLERESSMSKLVRVCEALKEQGFIFEEFSITKQIEKNGKKKSVLKTLEDVKKEYPSIDIEKVLEDTGVKLDYSIGISINNARGASEGKRSYLITEEERKRLIKMRILGFKKECSVSKLVRVCEALKEQGMKFEEFSLRKKIQKNGKLSRISKTLKDIGKEYSNIDIEKVLKETRVELDYPIGGIIAGARKAYKGNGTYVITEKEKQKLIKIGVINDKSKRNGQEIGKASFFAEVKACDEAERVLFAELEKNQNVEVDLDE